MSTKKNLELFQPTELVRGNVKAAMKDAAVGSSENWQVRLDQLRFIDNFNPRVHNADYDAHVDFLAKSMAENGFFPDKPIAGFVAKEGDKQIVYVTDGHSRTLAARRAVEVYGAEIESLPVVIKPAGTNMQDLLVSTVVSNQGRELSPYEKAIVIKRLVDMGVEEKVIAKRLGITGQYIADLLTLVGAPVAVRNMVANGQVAANVAVESVKKHGTGAAEKLKSGLDRAKAAGKTKVTRKHMGASLKVKGVIWKEAGIGETTITIRLSNPLDVEVVKGNLVALTIREDDSL